MGNAQTDEAAQMGADQLIDALRDSLSPEACAAAAEYLMVACTKSLDVDQQLLWLAEVMAEIAGGWDKQCEMAQELGLFGVLS